MSHQVAINYEGLSIRLQAECDSAIASLCQIDKELEFVHQTASKLESRLVKDYERKLLNSKTRLKNRIEAFKTELETVKALDRSADRGIQSQIMAKAKQLQQLAEELTGAKLDVVHSLIQQQLIDFANKTNERLDYGENYIEDLDERLITAIEGIDDIALKDCVYRLAIKPENKGRPFPELLIEAQAQLQEEEKRALNDNKDRILLNVKATLKDNGVPETAIAELTDGELSVDKLNQIHGKARAEIVDEKIRKQTLKIIIQALKRRGFVINTKDNLKIDRKSNVVKLLALKPDGRQAEFEISLNGKFMYHFEGYEGQACQKDIQPFMDDLENVYGLKVLKQEVIWSNPDKISTQKYQHMNVNKGRN